MQICLMHEHAAKALCSVQLSYGWMCSQMYVPSSASFKQCTCQNLHCLMIRDAAPRPTACSKVLRRMPYMADTSCQKKYSVLECNCLVERMTNHAQR